MSSLSNDILLLGRTGRGRAAAGDHARARSWLGTWIVFGALLVVVGLGGTGCQTPSSTVLESRGSGRRASGMVWPKPPAQPRIAWVTSLTHPKDLGLKASRWKGFARWLLGRDALSEELVQPFGVAVDKEGNLCVADAGTKVVWFFDLKKRRFQQWNKIGPYRLVSPVAVAKHKDRFYVADSGLAKILAFRTGKELLFEIDEKMDRPAGLAIAGDQLYVADSLAHRISVFDLQGNFLWQFGQRGTAPGQFNYPTHLATDSNGHLAVTDSMNARVQIFSLKGEWQSVIGRLGDGSGHFSRPKGVAVDGFGHVYVVDALFDNFQIFDLEGRFLLDVGSAGSDPGRFWLPNGIAIGGENLIFVADSYNKRVQVFEYLDYP